MSVYLSQRHSYRSLLITLWMTAVLTSLIREHGVPDKLLPTATDSAFHGLAHIIIDQQLSTLAAKRIAERVLAACGVCAQGLY